MQCSIINSLIRSKTGLRISQPEMSWNNQRQNQISNQKQLEDQFFSNNTLYTLLSSVETAAIKAKKGSMKEKRYQNYDIFQYSQKTLEELYLQIKTQMFSLANSILMFQHQHKKENYVFPKDFDEKRVQKELDYFKKIFITTNLDDFVKMVEKIREIIFEDANTFFENEQKELAKRMQQRKNNKSNGWANNSENVTWFVQHASTSGNHVHKLKEDFHRSGIDNARDIPVGIRPIQEEVQSNGKSIEKSNDSNLNQKAIMFNILNSFKKVKWPHVFQKLIPRSMTDQNYYRIIQNPMDLSTLERNLNDGKYKTLGSFKKDIQKIWENTYTFMKTQNKYNYKNQPYYKQAYNMEQFYKKILAQLEKNNYHK